MKFRPKKSLGQNFLQDKNILKYLSKLADISNVDNVLEIGPGSGNLTEFLIEKNPKTLTLIEKDKSLCIRLQEKFSNKVKVLNEDFLDFRNDYLDKDNLIIVGNLPYNVSTQILVKLIRSHKPNRKYKRFILMFQKEVADRIVAKFDTSKYGRISIISQWKFNIENVKNVEPSSFYPKPAVNSSILFFSPKAKYYEIKNIKNLEHITKVFFGFRRKMIKKSLSILFKNPEIITSKLNIDSSLRPQKIEPLTYFKLCNEYEKLTN